MKKMSMKIKRALLSVSDKDQLIVLAKKLTDFNVELISTGGTKKYLEENGFRVTSVESLTGNPEAFGGRMKSISFQITSSLLFRRGHEQDEIHAKELNIEPIDLVVCNLYPFDQYVGKEFGNESYESTLIENIDIGGPLMLRAAAKNYEGVTVLSSKTDYDHFLTDFNGEVSFQKRRELAIKTFKRIAEYDIMIADELEARYAPTCNTHDEKKWLRFLSSESLRYGENPHQSALMFKISNTKTQTTLANAEFIQGKELSYNNWVDADAAWRVMSDVHHFYPDKAVVSIIKHTNPCGLSVAECSIDALKESWEGDSVSSFGGILAFSKTFDETCALFLNERFIEVIIAPDFTAEALKVLSKKKNVRVLKSMVRPKDENEFMLKSLSGGLLIQNEDESNGIKEESKVMTNKSFNNDMQNLVDFGIIACKHLKSNGIALVMKMPNGHLSLVGAGMGQPNRLDSLRFLASKRASDKKLDLNQMLLVSDAFFPFADSIEVCHEVGIKNIIQPGGSIRDEEVIAACNKFEMAMMFTGKRHFRH